MADDIVTRLRAAARSGDLPLGVSFDCDAVADEIERLRREVQAWRDAAEAYERGALGRGDELVRKARRG